MSAARAKNDRAAIMIVAEFLRKECGLVFAEHKHYLFAQRLPCLLEKFQLCSLDELAAQLSTNAVLRRDVIHQMTTHETFFFRDSPQFRVLEEEILPEIAARVVQRRRRGQTRTHSIWSAACSTGQEPYSLAMLLHELRSARPDIGLLPTDLRILGTDISEEVLNRARQGVFSQLEVSRGIGHDRMGRFFEAHEGGYRAQDVIREHVQFRSLNLTRPFGAIGRFELVLCRNVLIYFSHETARRTLDRLAITQETGGYLMLGASESIYPKHDAYEEVKLGGLVIYRRV